MPGALFQSGATLGEKLEAIARLAIQGSRAPSVRAFAIDAARAAGGDAWAALETAYARLLERMVSVRDPGHAAGEDSFQEAHDTLEKMAGDCDDATILVLAIARSLGFRAAAVTLSVPTDKGPSPVHVFAEIERSPGVWVSADLEQGLALGTEPGERFPTAMVRERWELEAPASALGFLPALIAAGVGLVGTIIGASATRSAAKEGTRAADASADAARDVAAVNLEIAQGQERTAAEQAQLTREALQAQRYATDVSAILQTKALISAKKTTKDVLAFANDMLPVVAAAVVLRALAPVAEKAMG